MSRTRYRIFEEEHPYFLTETIVAWLPVFSRPEFVQIVFDSWKFLQREREIRIYGYVILENHLHWIASGAGLAEQVGRFKSFTARRILDGMQERKFTTLLQELAFYNQRDRSDQQYQLWQQGSHPKQIQNDEMMLQKLEYAPMTPVRSGYVDEPIHWRYSSARNYAGMGGLLEVVTDWR